MLLEREDALAALDDWLAEAASGAGRMALLGGEAGIGKTSLVCAFGERHGRDAQVWWGACDALSSPRPLGALDDIARCAGGHLAEVVAADTSRHERFSGLRDALVSPLRPVVVVVEDVHWADEATRDLLVYLARRVADTHAVVVVTYRDDEIGTGHPLRGVLGHLATLPAVRRWVLTRLSEPAVACSGPSEWSRPPSTSANRPGCCTPREGGSGSATSWSAVRSSWGSRAAGSGSCTGWSWSTWTSGRSPTRGGAPTMPSGPATPMPCWRPRPRRRGRRPGWEPMPRRTPISHARWTTVEPSRRPSVRSCWSGTRRSARHWGSRSPVSMPPARHCTAGSSSARRSGWRG